MNVGEYIDGVRLKLTDSVQPYRFGDGDLSASLAEAVRRARQVRPSLAYSDGRLLAEASEVSFTAARATPVRQELDRYAEALMLLAAARVLTNDNSDTMNGAVAERWRAQGLELLAI